MDLSPRDVPTAAPVRTRGKRWPAVLVLVLVLVGGGIVVTKFLGSAIDYYCNVDEIGSKSGCEAGRRLRVQGNVEEGSVASDGAVTTFMISFNGVEMPVRYEGDPGGIFQECVPVVVHGRVDEATAADGTVTRTFDGDSVEVKHSNEYEAENSDRLDQAQDACSLQV
ncbi:MAG: cytochrome c maturation protein CcmE [Ilumatobacteraceae bacterium]